MLWGARGTVAHSRNPTACRLTDSVVACYYGQHRGTSVLGALRIGCTEQLSPTFEDSRTPSHPPSLPSPCGCVSRVTLLRPFPAWCQRQGLACWSTTTHHCAWAGSGRTRCGHNTTHSRHHQHSRPDRHSEPSHSHPSTCFRPCLFCLPAGNIGRVAATVFAPV